jgi:hypothetical protein
MQTLYEYDGPKIVLLKTPGTSYILGVAIINELYEEPFYGAEISSEQMHELLDGEYSLRYAFIRPKFKQWFVFDLADLDFGTEITLFPLRLSAETEKYLPGRKFFASDFTEELNLGSAVSGKSEERILVDGNWEISDFGDLYGGYSDLYSFADGLKKFSDVQVDALSKRTIKSAFQKQWQGGGSYGSFYRTLRTVQGPADRLSLGGFEYHSPGYVDFEGQKALLDSVKSMLNDFGDRYLQIKKNYNELYKYLQINKLLSLAADKFDRSSDIANSVSSKGLEFSKMLPNVRWNDLLKLSDGDQLVATKVLLSLFRRLERLNEFQLQGRVTF